MFEYLEGRFGTTIIEFSQSGWLGSAMYYILLPFNYLGSEMGYMLVLPVIYWSIDKKTGLRLFIIAMFGAITSTFFKTWLKRPRPFHVSPDTIRPIELTSEFGFPSGHSIFGAIFGVTVFRTVDKRSIKLLLLVFILLMGISRMVHGMHFLQDIVAGWIIGICLVVLYFKLEQPIIKAWGNYSLPVKITLLTGLCIGFYACTLLFSSTYQVSKSLLSSFGALYGGVIGILFEEAHIKFTNPGKIKLRIYRGIVGLIAMFIVVFLLEAAFYGIVHNSQNHWALLLYLIRYMLVGLWIIAGIPYLFIKFNLK
jgi:membrane-associated phospholipid phosphatase